MFRFIVNVTVGKMTTKALPSFLLHCAELDATNSETITKIFNTAIHILWPNDTTNFMNLVFLFVMDAAAYMMKTTNGLKILYTNMVHITCATYGLHRICEVIRAKFSLTNTLISNVKKLFLKSPSRVHLFKTMHPNIPFLPEPVTTRWGTWIKADEYYCNNFFKIVEVLEELDDDAEE